MGNRGNRGQRPIILNRGQRPIIFIGTLLFFAFWLKPAFALEHTQRDGLFSMDIPEQWHWVEYPEEIVIAYPDGKTVAIDIELLPSKPLSRAGMKKALKEGNDRMIKEGVEAHHGTFIDEKEMKLDGVYATQLDFKTAAPDFVHVTYIAFFNKGYAITITYGTQDDNMRAVMDDAVATIKF